MVCKKLLLSLGLQIHKDMRLPLPTESFIYTMKMVKKKISSPPDQQKKIIKATLSGRYVFRQITKKLRSLSPTTSCSFTK